MSYATQRKPTDWQILPADEVTVQEVILDDVLHETPVAVVITHPAVRGPKTLWRLDDGYYCRRDRQPGKRHAVGYIVRDLELPAPEVVQ